MQNRSSVTGVVFGAALGGAIGYLFFTESGQRHREELSRRLDQLADDFSAAKVLWHRLYEIGERYRSGPGEALLADIADLLRDNRPRPIGGAA